MQTYDEWFARADEQKRRMAVGTRRYSTAQEILGHEPTWIDFVDPDTGGLLTLAELQAETWGERQTRAMKVQALIRERGQAKRDVGRLGFLPS